MKQLTHGTRSAPPEALIYRKIWKVCLSYLKFSKDMEIFLKLPKAIKSYQKLSKAIKSYQKLSKAIKSYQKLLKTIKSYQKLSKAIYSNNLSYLQLPRTETNGYIISNISRLLMISSDSPLQQICFIGFLLFQALWHLPWNFVKFWVRGVNFLGSHRVNLHWEHGAQESKIWKVLEDGLNEEEVFYA